MHDHPRPEAKSTSEARRSLGSGRRVRGLAVLLAKEAALGNKVNIITSSIVLQIFNENKIQLQRYYQIFFILFQVKKSPMTYTQYDYTFGARAHVSKNDRGSWEFSKAKYANFNDMRFWAFNFSLEHLVAWIFHFALRW